MPANDTGWATRVGLGASPRVLSYFRAGSWSTHFSSKGIRLGGVAALAWLLLMHVPVDVPDATSPSTSNHNGAINMGNNVGQVFVPRQDGLKRISVVAASERLANNYSAILTIREDSPSGRIVREVSKPLSEFPEGDPHRYRPGGLESRWTSFDFAPIADSAGKRLYFSIDGRSVPVEYTVRALMRFRGGYPQGMAYVNGDEVHAHVVFRTHSRGQVKDVLGVLGENLTAKKEGILASGITYVGLAALYVGLLAGLFVVTWRVLGTSDQQQATSNQTTANSKPKRTANSEQQTGDPWS